MSSRLAAACLIAVNMLPARATEIPPRPTEPILPPMPARAAWMLEFEGAPRKPTVGADSSAEAKPDPAVNRVTIFRDGRICRIVSEKTIGGYREAWIIDGNSVFLVNGNRCVLVDASAFPCTDFSSGDFEYFQWLRPDNYVDFVDFEKRKAFVFEADSLTRPMTARERARMALFRQPSPELAGLTSDSPEKAPRAVSDAELLRLLGWGEKFRAWIDATTQRPLYLESGNLRIRVRYLPDPGPLTPPPPVLRRQEAIKKENAILSRKPARPARRQQ